MTTLKIVHVSAIYDNGEYVVIETASGTTVQLPIGTHSISIHSSVDNPDNYNHYDTVYVELFV